MTEVLSASMSGGHSGFHRSASTASLLQRSSSTSMLGSLAGKKSHHHSSYKTQIVPPSPPLSPQISSLQLDHDGFDSGLCLDDDELFLPLYDYANTSPPGDSSESYTTESITSSAYLSTSLEVPERKDSASPETPDVVITAVDDFEIKHEPSRHVDYLSHDWTEEQICSSWRYMVGKRNAYQYSARLENASWRTWAKSRFNLGTISPKELNWLKECDVTWLYGPLSDGTDKVSWKKLRSNCYEDSEYRYSPPYRYSPHTHGKKPILKKRSMSEVMLQNSLSSSSLLKQATAAIEAQKSERGGLHPSDRPIPSRTFSDYSGYRKSAINSVGTECPTALASSSSGGRSPTCEKHISFNDKVQQCIAVTTEEEEHDDDDLYPEAIDESSSDDDGLVMLGSSRPKISRSSSSSRSLSEQKTIAMLPAAELKPPDEPVVKPKKSSFTGGFSSFFSLPSVGIPQLGGSSSASDSKTTAPSMGSMGKTTATHHSIQHNHMFDDDDLDDDELAELNWGGNGAFANRRDSLSLVRPRFEAGLTEFDGSDYKHDITSSTSIYSNYSNYEEDEDDQVAEGLFGRAVDTVNTVKDIAHVFWNVGWRR